MAAAGLTFSGCGQKAEPGATAPTGPAEPKAPMTAVSPTNSPVSPAVIPVATPATNEAAPPSLANVVAEDPAPPTLKEPEDPVKQAQRIIDGAKGFAERQLYTVALSNMRALAVFSLTPEQQTAVVEIKTAIKKAMGDEAYDTAIKAMGGEPKGKE